MTEKPRKIMKKMNNPDARERFLSDFNASTLDPVGPVGGQDQQMRVLDEMSAMGQAEKQIIRKAAPEISAV